jgi:hypothetical protein
MKFVKRILELQSSLTELQFAYLAGTYEDRSSLAELGNAIKSQSSSLRDIQLQFGDSVFPPQTSSANDLDGAFVAITAENMCIGSFQEFKALMHLSVPFDALFGPDPRNTISFSQLLPANLRHLTLQNCMFRPLMGPRNGE